MIIPPDAIDLADEMVIVPLVPDAANTIVPKLVPLSLMLNVVDAVAAVLRVNFDVQVIPNCVDDPPEGIVWARVLVIYTTAWDAVYAVFDSSSNQKGWFITLTEQLDPRVHVTPLTVIES